MCSGVGFLVIVPDAVSSLLSVDNRSVRLASHVVSDNLSGIRLFCSLGCTLGIVNLCMCPMHLTPVLLVLLTLLPTKVALLHRREHALVHLREFLRLRLHLRLLKVHLGSFRSFNLLEHGRLSGVGVGGGVPRVAGSFMCFDHLL